MWHLMTLMVNKERNRQTQYHEAKNIQHNVYKYNNDRLTAFDPGQPG